MNDYLFKIHLCCLVTVGLLCGISVDAQPGTLDLTFTAGITNPTVYAVFLQPDGGVLVRNGWPSYNLVKLGTDGVTDTNFNPGLPAGASVSSMGSLPDGRVIISGSFLEVQGVARPCLARLNGNGTLDSAFVPQIMPANIPMQPTNAPPLPYSPTNGVGMILVQPDGKVLVTSMSYMTATNGSALPAVARLNTDGLLDSSFATVTNAPYRMALQPDGKILIEQAISWNYPGSNIVYRLNQDGTRDSSFNQVNITGWANVLLPQTNSIYLGGFIIRVNGINSGWMARVDLSGQLDTSFNSPFYDYGNGIEAAIPQPDGKVLIGGTFWKVNPTYKNLARLNSNGAVDATFTSTGANSFVHALAGQPDGKTLVAGEFTAVNGVATPPLVRLIGDSDTGPGTVAFDLAETEVFENSGSVTLTIDRIWGNQGDISVSYQTVPGSAVAGSDYAAQSGILVFHDGEIAKTITVPLIDKGSINDLKTFKVVLSSSGGGAGIGAQSNCVVNILNVHGPASFDPGFSVGPGLLDGAVSDVAVQPDGAIVIGGWFQQVGGVPRRGVARLTQAGALDPNFNPGSELDYGGNSGWLNFVKLQTNGQILVAGIFTMVNGTNENYLARLNPDGSLDTSFNDGTGPLGTGNVVGDIRGMELLNDGRMIVGGGFNTYNGIIRNGLVRLSTNGIVDPAYQPAGAGIVNTFGLQTDGKVIFSAFASTYAARINADGTTTRTNADGTTNITFIASADNYVRQVSCLPDGTTMIAGSFSTINGHPRRCLARLFTDGTVDSAFVPDMSLFMSAGTVPYIYKFAVQSDGKVVAALKTYAAPAGNYLVRFKNDGSLDTDFEPIRFAIPTGDNDTISAIAIQSDNGIIAAGQFQTVNGLSRPYLVRLKGGGRSGSRLLLVNSLKFTNNHCGLTLAVSPGKPFVLQTSTDMVNWLDLSTNTALTSVFNIVDDQISGASRRFYRVKQLLP
jgi:uncharacterized delta-60 repeat protein